MNRRLSRAKEEHLSWLKRMGIKKPGKISVPLQNLYEPKAGLASTSDRIPGNCFRKDVDDYKWKRDRYETKETKEAIEAKKKAIAPLYNKGPNAYITPKTDIETLGRKI